MLATAPLFNWFPHKVRYYNFIMLIPFFTYLGIFILEKLIQNPLIDFYL